MSPPAPRTSPFNRSDTEYFQESGGSVPLHAGVLEALFLGEGSEALEDLIVSGSRSEDLLDPFVPGSTRAARPPMTADRRRLESATSCTTLLRDASKSVSTSSSEALRCFSWRATSLLKRKR